MELSIYQAFAYQKIIFSSLNQNICCVYSKEPSLWAGSYGHPKHMFKLMDKSIFTILRSKFLFIFTYVSHELVPFYCICAVYPVKRYAISSGNILNFKTVSVNSKFGTPWYYYLHQPLTTDNRTYHCSVPRLNLMNYVANTFHSTSLITTIITRVDYFYYIL